MTDLRGARGASALIPVETRRMITLYYPDTGPTWLEKLPSLIERYSRKWRLTLHSAYTGGEASWKAPVTLADGTKAVLKLSVPSVIRQAPVSAALRAWDGQGAVRLLEADDSDRAQLIERCEPGTNAFGLPTEEGNAVAAQVLGEISIPPPKRHAFEALAHRVARKSETMQGRLDRADCPIDRSLIRDAASIFEDLPLTADRQALLHGDFHLGNVLSSSRGWLATDPSPMVGDPSYEVAYFMVHRRDFRQVHRQIERVAFSLGLRAKRIRDWILAETISALGWHVQAGDEEGIANRLENLKQLLSVS